MKMRWGSSLVAALESLIAHQEKPPLGPNRIERVVLVGVSSIDSGSIFPVYPLDPHQWGLGHCLHAWSYWEMERSLIDSCYRLICVGIITRQACHKPIEVYRSVGCDFLGFLRVLLRV